MVLIAEHRQPFRIAVTMLIMSGLEELVRVSVLGLESESTTCNLKRLLNCRPKSVNVCMVSITEHCKTFCNSVFDLMKSRPTVFGRDQQHAA